MEVQSDFRDMLVLLNEHNVEYLIVGGYALAFHGAPRFTGDIDIFLNLTEKDFQHPNKVVQLGVPPVRIDLLTSISGVSWEEADASKESGYFGDVPVCYIGRQQYIANKRSAGRKKDLADIEALGEDGPAKQDKSSVRGKPHR